MAYLFWSDLWNRATDTGASDFTKTFSVKFDKFLTNLSTVQEELMSSF